MSVLESLAVVLGGAALLNVLAGVAVLDVAAVRRIPDRAREALPYLGFLVGVLLVNKVAREFGPEVSWIVGWNVTGYIYALEGGLVATVQSLATPVLTAYFSAVYLFGYVFLLTFPFVVYATRTDAPDLERLAVAFGLNYALGLVCYVLFISYGPRNLIPDLVEPLLYATYPQAQFVTSQVNANTNVFPSLHTSLSVTVAVQAWRTHDRFPRWTYIAVPLATSVAVSTMYLGIHWATDVVAGVVLGVGSVLAADRVVG
jgi:membrane-associated phospholipid phosphatase